MLVVIEQTYRGKHGLFVGGHTYDLSNNQIAAIDDELAPRKKKLQYRKVKDANQINRPTVTKKDELAPRKKKLQYRKVKDANQINRPTATKKIEILTTYRGKEGVYEQGRIITLPVRKITAIEADCKSAGVKFEYELVKEQTTPNNKQVTGSETK